MNVSVLKEKKQHIGVLTLKVLKPIYDWPVTYLFVTIYVYYYWAIGLSLAVYIFHKGILS